MNINQTAELIFDDSDFQKVFNTNYEAGNLGSAQTFTAHIIEITPPLSQPAAIRSVRWQIDNSSGLLEPQNYGGVTFRLAEGHRCLTVPLSAIVGDIVVTSGMKGFEDNAKVSITLEEDS